MSNLDQTCANKIRKTLRHSNLVLICSWLLCNILDDENDMIIRYIKSYHKLITC